LLKTRKFDAAIREYEEALRPQPSEPIAHYNFAVALEVAGEKARARQEYEAYLQLSPTAPDAGEVHKHLRELPSSKR
jgi:Flp pilus assembly protein TadD